jgi:imidazolonepropionase-like amidohydrolase
VRCPRSTPRALGYLLTVALAAACATTSPTPDPLPAPALRAFRFGRLVDPATGSTLERALVLVRGERIAYVGHDESKIPNGTPLLDWSRYTGLPGLIDAHTHVTFVTDGAPGTNPFERASELPAARALPLVHECLLRTLRLGVTSVIDKGVAAGNDRELREAVRKGRLAGPRLFVAGPGLQPTDRSVEGVRAEVRRVVTLGVDLIKIWADECSDRRLDCPQVYSTEALGAAIDEAHRLGKPVAVHAYHAGTAADAVRAGADSLEHAEGIDDATLDEMVKRGTVYVPTIDHNRYYREHAAEYGHTAADGRGLAAFLEKNLATAARAHQRGVAIAMGSDAVFSMCGENTRELGWLVRAGLTPMQALRAATFEAARSVGKQNEIGRVAPGYFADLIAVEGDPLANVDAVINHVRVVIQGGKQIDLGPTAHDARATPAPGAHGVGR